MTQRVFRLFFSPLPHAPMSRPCTPMPHLLLKCVKQAHESTTRHGSEVEGLKPLSVKLSVLGISANNTHRFPRYRTDVHTELEKVSLSVKKH